VGVGFLMRPTSGRQSFAFEPDRENGERVIVDAAFLLRVELQEQAGPP
jgi:hypothetical protein